MLNFPVIFCENDLSFDIEFDEVIRYEVLVGDIEVYDGDYTVVPTVDGEVLETAKRYMEEDLTIKAIPYFNVGNTAGGSTVYIGKELD